MRVAVYVAMVAKHLVGVTEIAEMLGISRQRAHQLTRAEGFPAPVAELSAGRIWNRDEVEEWGREAGRLP